MTAQAQWELLPDAAPQQVFGGGAQPVATVWHNSGGRTVEASLDAQLWQDSSDTAVKFDLQPWKTLRLLPGQTVSESALLKFPSVNGRTEFLVRWCAGSNRIFGSTSVLVYPTNLMDELKSLVAGGSTNPGVLDPHNQIKPLLHAVAVNFTDLASMRLEDFAGRLALIGPCTPEDSGVDGLPAKIAALAEHGTAVVWLQSPPASDDQIHPSFYLVPKAGAAVVVADPGLVADLPDRPQAQLNLIYFCKLALRPEPFSLPQLTKE